MCSSNLLTGMCRMLDMGFEPQIRSIINDLPVAPTRQTVFFTATWPKEVQMLALDFLEQPVLITAGRSLASPISYHKYMIDGFIVGNGCR